MALEVEAFYLNFVTTTYGETASTAAKSEFWILALTIMKVICKELGKVRVDSDTAYGL